MKVLPIQQAEGKQITLDLKDKKILYMLSHNARFPNSKIAKNTNISRDGVNYRIQKMSENNIIQGYRTLINVNKLGYNSYHSFLSLHTPKEENETELVKFLQENKNTNVLMKYTGMWDFELGVMINDLTQLDNLFTQIINKSPFLQDYEILILLQTYKSSVFPEKFLEESKFVIEAGRNDGSFFKDFEKEQELKKEDLDEKDFQLLRILSDNARMPIIELANKLKLSPDAVVYRIRKLVRGKIILEFRPIINYSALGFSVNAVLFKLQNMDDKNELRLKEFLRQHQNILWAVKTIGRWNLLMYTITHNQEEFHKTINDIRNNFGENIKNYEILAAYEEYKYTYFPEGVGL